MKKIGITGGVGCGKSAVMEYISAHYDAVTIRADEVGRKLMEPDAPCFDPVVALFGPRILRNDGTLDRAKIAEEVFADEQKRKALDDIIHPAVRTYITDAMALAAQAGHKWFFLEAALLIEEDYRAILDELWYIYAEQSVRRKRLAASRGYSAEKIDSIMKSQLSEEAFRGACDFEIDNSGDFRETAAAIDRKMRKKKKK
ncbi:MAG: dephospho-CoA kinase [Lachnospiraceae bacterium]|jgi:dephospho-CoA kinase|nr:dephospho-CoA kinase [Lachnospiraceae bacterium]MCI1328157.1 dephospho-CoA kinase [Lachnospiraceae bacterium]